MPCRIIDTGAGTPEENMSIDALLLEGLESDCEPVLHFYDWLGPCATYGHFIRPFDYLDERAFQKNNLKIARRPTGGGIIFHEFDFAFSVLVPSIHPKFSINTLDNYALINCLAARSIASFRGGEGGMSLLPEEHEPLDLTCRHFCMAKPTKYDIMIEGRKVGGGAQRRTRAGFLHQGSIALAMPAEEYMSSLLKPGTRILEAMAKHSFPLLCAPAAQHELREARMAIKEAMIASFKEL